MAAPFLWFDALAKRGWLPVLSGAAIKVLWAIGHFYFAKLEQAKADADMLRRMSGLSRSGFYEARAELAGFGLIEVSIGTRTGQYRDYRTHIYRLVEPVPPVPVDLASVRANGSSRQQGRSSPAGHTKSSTRADESVRRTEQTDGPNSSRMGFSAPGGTTAKTQLGQALEVRDSQVLGLVILSRLPGVSEEVVSLVALWATVVQRSPSSRQKVLADAVAAICKRFPDLPAASVGAAVEDAVAALHPIVQQAVATFESSSVEIATTET